MWETAGAKLHDWYIVVIALLLFGGGFFLASPETAAAPLPEHQHQVTAAAARHSP